MPARALFVMMLCNVVWALNVVVSKVAIVDLGSPPLFYALLRSLIVAIVLIPLLRPLPENLGRVLLIGLAISGGSFALLFMGLQTADPATAGAVGLVDGATERWLSSADPLPLDELAGRVDPGPAPDGEDPAVPMIAAYLAQALDQALEPARDRILDHQLGVLTVDHLAAEMAAGLRRSRLPAPGAGAVNA